jgi:hypothetical protein
MARNCEPSNAASVWMGTTVLPAGKEMVRCFLPVTRFPAGLTVTIPLASAASMSASSSDEPSRDTITYGAYSVSSTFAFLKIAQSSCWSVLAAWSAETRSSTPGAKPTYRERPGTPPARMPVTPVA